MTSTAWFGLLFAAVAAMTLWGMLTRHPFVPAWVHRHDKTMHFMAFALLALLAQAAWPSIPLVWVWMVLTALGLLAEGLQHWFASRGFCWGDATANAMGAASVLLLMHWQG